MSQLTKRPDEAVSLVLSIRQTSEALNVSRSTVYSLLATKKLSAISIGRRRLVTRESIERLASAGEGTA